MLWELSGLQSENCFHKHWIMSFPSTFSTRIGRHKGSPGLWHRGKQWKTLLNISCLGNLTIEANNEKQFWTFLALETWLHLDGKKSFVYSYGIWVARTSCFASRGLGGSKRLSNVMVSPGNNITSGMLCRTLSLVFLASNHSILSKYQNVLLHDTPKWCCHFKVTPSFPLLVSWLVVGEVL